MAASVHNLCLASNNRCLTSALVRLNILKISIGIRYNPYNRQTFHKSHLLTDIGSNGNKQTSKCKGDRVLSQTNHGVLMLLYPFKKVLK